jgi:IS30 family transposase
MKEHGHQSRVHNGSTLGHGAQAVRDAIASMITTLPEQLCRSPIWDQGAEMAQSGIRGAEENVASGRSRTCLGSSSLECL